LSEHHNSLSILFVVQVHLLTVFVFWGANWWLLVCNDWNRQVRVDFTNFLQIGALTLGARVSLEHELTGSLVATWLLT
jgi:hypothetical protein